jgi:glyoxylase-like metal-dependent hydrolase (beta-lactamase superfamily II)
MTARAWQELGDGVFVRRHRELDLNVGLVIGDELCLVIDTRSSAPQGGELAGAVRELTSLPWTVVNTHAHYDHCFGNVSFLPADIWAHERCAAMLRSHGEVQRELTVRAYRTHGLTEQAGEIDATEIVVPEHTFDTGVTIDLGSCMVRLDHLGRGHTDNDVVVRPDGTAVVFAGDLVEEGAPPAFEDGFPLDWPATLDRLLGLDVEVVVPGHGAVVDRGFVEEQAETIATVVRLARDAHANGREASEVVDAVPLPTRAAQAAVDRAYRQLDGAPPYDDPEAIREAAGLRP